MPAFHRVLVGLLLTAKRVIPVRNRTNVRFTKAGKRVMRRFSKSTVLGLALAAASGCGISGDKGQSDGTGEVKVDVTLPSGTTISTVAWVLDCGPTSPVPTPGPSPSDR